MAKNKLWGAAIFLYFSEAQKSLDCRLAEVARGHSCLLADWLLRACWHRSWRLPLQCSARTKLAIQSIGGTKCLFLLLSRSRHLISVSIALHRLTNESFIHHLPSRFIHKLPLLSKGPISPGGFGYYYADPKRDHYVRL